MDGIEPHPLLFQVNTCVLLREVGERLGRDGTLDDVPDELLDGLAEQGFDWFWPLGVWQTSPASREVSLTDGALRRTLQEALPDLQDDDITGSPFAIGAYEVRTRWGGVSALARLRERLSSRGLRLLLDFVPNHTGLDHVWLEEHPEYYIHGTADDLEREPWNYIRRRSRGGEIVLAHGRDPYFAGWPDTLQLDYRHAGLRRAMGEQLGRIASRCDAVRCDMAMLVQPDVFARTWQGRPPPIDGSAPSDTPFWREAIARVREVHPQFVFMAEVYWGREWELQQEGFDYTYDKELYDRLRDGGGHRVREHLLADLSYQARSARFLENHDEPRAAAAFPPDAHRAAAVTTYFAPGLRFFHEGQFEGRRVKVSMHVGRRPKEHRDEPTRRFYSRLLSCLRRPEVHTGRWTLWVCRPAWDGNESWRDMIVMSWVDGSRQTLIAVNFAPRWGQCYVRLDLPSAGSPRRTLVDLLGDARYERDAHGLRDPGLYLDMPPWGTHVFEVVDGPCAAG